MSKLVKRYQCFIASPNDMREARKAVISVFDDLNKQVGESLGFYVQSITGEADAVPDIGEYAQDVINRQLRPDACDYFVMILGGRLGTETPSYASGTAEEFELAYKSWRAIGSPRILIYIQKAAKLTLDNVNMEQYAKVSKFKKHVEDYNCYYKEFDEIVDLKAMFRGDIEKIAHENCKIEREEEAMSAMEAKLQNQLDEALQLFSNQPRTWIDRRLCEEDNMPKDLGSKTAGMMDAEEIIDGVDSVIIKAPPQSGLTSLGRWLALKAFKRDKKWGVLDCATVKVRKIADVIQACKQEFKCENLDCLIVDSWSADMRGAKKIIEAVESECGNCRLIILETSINCLDVTGTFACKTARKFRPLHLLPLSRTDVRKAVSACCGRFSYDETTVLNKIMADMEALNIQRSPMNCWTLLTVAEQNFQETPINRSQMLDDVLFALFNLQDIPTYSERPDVKDCEHLLGYICDWMIRKGEYEFSEDDFMSKAKQYCDECLVDLDFRWVYDVLMRNKIFVRTADGMTRFWAAFWVYYFAAKHMRYDARFRDFILSENHYSAFPEIIEFYTGDTRGESAVLKILSDDLEATMHLMAEKLGIEKPLNPLRQLKWSGSDADVERMKKGLHDFVQNSDVPDYIKDQHADEKYNYIKPYNQSIEHYIEEASFHKFTQEMSALARALRNSDFADTGVRRDAMKILIRGWLEVAKVIFVIAPSLAAQGRTSFSDTVFYLGRGFENSENNSSARFMQILMAAPVNVINYVADDIASQRNARLFYAMLEDSPSELAEHLIMRYLVRERPKGWEVQVNRSIHKIAPRSYYQDDIISAMKSALRFDYCDDRSEQNLRRLLLESGSIFYQTTVTQLEKKNFVPHSEVGGVAAEK